MDKIKLRIHAKDGHLRPEDIDIYDALTNAQRSDIVGVELRFFADTPLVVLATRVDENNKNVVELVDLDVLVIG